MAESHRDLHAVPEPLEEEAPETGGSAPWWAWIAVVGFILCAAGWFTAQRGAAALQGELDASQAELANTHAELRAHERHLEAVQQRSGVLAGSLQELALEAQHLAEEVARDPRAPVPAEASEATP
jgi:hypothetical protein